MVAKFQPIIDCRFRFRHLQIFFKLIPFETRIVTTNPCAVIQTKTLFVVSKIIFKFFLESSLGIWISYSRFLAIFVIHFPSSFKCCAIFLFEHVICVDYIVVKIIRRSKHRCWNIGIIIARIL